MDEQHPGTDLPALPLSGADLKLIEAARQYADRSRARNTRRAYEADWRLFAEWCRKNHPGQEVLPANPALVALYLVDLAENTQLRTKTIKRRASGIAYKHRRAGLEVPTQHKYVKDMLEGIVRNRPDPDHGRATIESDALREIMENAGPPVRLQDMRDRAMVLLNFGNGRRRSEIAGLDVENLEMRDNGILITISRSKTDQRGVGLTTWLPKLREADKAVCAVRALQDWLRATEITDGPVFRTFDLEGHLTGNRVDGRDVTRALKRTLEAAGVPEETISRIASHSLRRGFITSADKAGVGVHAIMKTTGHKDRRTVDVYVRSDLIKDAPLLDIFGNKG